MARSVAEAPTPFAGDGGRAWRRWTRAAAPGAALFAIVAGIAIWRAAARGPRFRLETAAVDRGTIAGKMTATGTLSAIVTVQVGTQVSGTTDGVVISRNVDVGQTVAASLQAPTLFVIAGDLTRMQVDTSVAEGDVAHVKDGMPVTFTVDAYDFEVFHGVVRQVRNSAQTVQNVVTYDAVIDVANPDLRLRPGMTANVAFVYERRDDALRVPTAALRFRPPAAVDGTAPRPTGPAAPDWKTVWVVHGGAARPVRIRAGLTDGSLTEVVEGAVAPGDLVATAAAEGQ